MLMQIIILILASIGVSYQYTAQAVQVLLHGLLDFHQMIVGWLGYIFSAGTLAHVIKESLALFVLPMVMAGLVALVYWSIRRQRMPHFMALFWVFWLVQTAVVVITTTYH